MNDSIPKIPYWNNYLYPDSTKLAIASAWTWEKHGWRVNRYHTRDIVPGETGFAPFEGKLKPELEHYALEFWQQWHVIEHLTPGWFFTTDVFNNGFTPAQARTLELDNPNKSWISLEANGSLAAFYATTGFVHQMKRLIVEYDHGFHERPMTTSFISDEVLAKYFLRQSALFVDKMGFALATSDWRERPLIHISRSVLQWYE